MGTNLMQEILAQAERASSGSGGRNRDAIVEVLGYDTEKKTMQVQEGERVFNVHIRPGRDQSHAKPDTDPDFEGNMIDTRMSEILSPGTRIILECLTDYGQNGPDSRSMPINWVHSTPPKENKLQTGVVSLGGHRTPQGKLVTNAVNLWAPQSYKPDQLEQIAKAFDQSAQYAVDRKQLIDNDEKPTPRRASFGFSLRAISNGEVVSYTPPVTYNKEEQRPPNAADLQSTLNGFRDTLEAFGISDAQIEICVCRSFPPTTRGGIPAPRMLIDSKGKFMPGMGEFPNFGNQAMAAPNAVMKISPGKYDPRTQQMKGEHEEYVNTLLMHTKAVPLQEAILTADGQQVTLHESLEIAKPERPQQENAEAASTDQNQTSVPQTPAQQDTSAQQAPDSPKPQAPASSVDEDDDLDGALAEASARMAAPGM
jgi:hypothetical protein